MVRVANVIQGMAWQRDSGLQLESNLRRQPCLNTHVLLTSSTWTRSWCSPSFIFLQRTTTSPRTFDLATKKIRQIALLDILFLRRTVFLSSARPRLRRVAPSATDFHQIIDLVRSILHDPASDLSHLNPQNSIVQDGTLQSHACCRSDRPAKRRRHKPCR